MKNVPVLFMICHRVHSVYSQLFEAKWECDIDRLEVLSEAVWGQKWCQMKALKFLIASF